MFLWVFIGVASLQTCRPGPTIFCFDHSTASNKLCALRLSKKLQRSKCWWDQCVLVMRAIFRLGRNESQPGLQLVEKLATPRFFCLFVLFCFVLFIFFLLHSEDSSKERVTSAFLLSFLPSGQLLSRNGYLTLYYMWLFRNFVQPFCKIKITQSWCVHFR